MIIHIYRLEMMHKAVKSALYIVGKKQLILIKCLIKLVYLLFKNMYTKFL